jgi:hypothetical protein
LKEEKSILQQIKRKVSSEQYINVLENIENIGEKKAKCLDILKFKNPLLSFIFALILGPFGVDRFYQGRIKLGLIKILLTLLTVAGVFIIFFSPWKVYLYLLGSWVYVLWGATISFAFAFISWYVLDLIISTHTIFDENYYKIIDKLEEANGIKQNEK